jgi:catechol 2,3-dioxygenase-like lactoylglutathione lyase family enzyme
MTDSGPLLNQLNLVVSDMERSVAFYRLLGVAVEAEPGARHVGVTLPNGMLLEFDTLGFAAAWDSGVTGETGSGVVIGFSVASREAVDALYAALTAAGHAGHQQPYDAFWGARYAIVEDPDGNSIGLMSPIEAGRKFWPPVPPPAGAGVHTFD